MTAYYNEIDTKAAAWIRELIKAGVITDGEVDTRSIEDVVPADLAGFQRCHFFAGIGVWDYALNRAGWPDDRRVWTGSCPCQPFSAAGKGGGFDDERHLWPAWFHLINVGRPDTVFGEQVASKDGLTWLDLVSSDVEGIGYTIAPLDIPAAGVGAPHIRQRLFWVADSDSGESRGRHREANGTREEVRSRPGVDAEYGGEFNPLGGHAISIGRRGRRDGDSPRDERQTQTAGSGSSGGPVDNASDARCDDAGQYRSRSPLQPARSIESSGIGILADALPTGRPERWSESGHGQITGSGEPERLGDTSNGGHGMQRNGSPGFGQSIGPSLTNGFWHDAEWIYCTDEKYRPTKPGIFPLAHGTPGRVGLLRGFGNAINGEVAKAFIESYLENRDQ